MANISRFIEISYNIFSVKIMRFALKNTATSAAHGKQFAVSPQGAQGNVWESLTEINFLKIDFMRLS
ncbi:MAG TPA: hypothetical protein DEQ14_03120 [Treponema sp.]|nr:hypothetical protein [Treponema sp.]